MRTFHFILALVFSVGSVTRAADTEVSAAMTNGASIYAVGMSPFLDMSVKDAVYRGLVKLIVEDIPLNSTLEVYDAYNLRSITRLTIPKAKVFNSPKTRANQFAVSIGEIKKFLAQDNVKPNAPKPGFDGAVRLPQFCDFLAQDHPPRDENTKVPLLLIGSPLYQDAREPDFSMVDGYFPSDGHLIANREQSVFGCNSSDSPLRGPILYWAYFGDPWVSELHRERVTRFWALYAERRGGRLASFSADLSTAMIAFSSEAPGRSAASNGWIADQTQTKPEMLRVSRNVKLVDWLTGDNLSDATPPPPSKMVGPLKIGIRWKENIDLDLYAAPRHDGETLFFQHPRSPEGYYFKDHRSSPGREYEYIEFESPVDIRKVRAFVNFYGGSCLQGPRGEVRIEFLNRIYQGTFRIEASEGNQGRSGSAQADYWAQIPVAAILGIDETARQSARNAN